MDKESIFRNYKLAILSVGNESWVFIKDEDELTRMIDNNEINGGDVIIRLTPDTLRLATEKNFIEIK
jgi:hypothetical protein